MQQKKRYAAVGTGGRVMMYIDPLASDHREDGELVGLCDTSLVRANYHRERLQRDYGYHDVPVYAAADFEKMVRETQPDTIMVTTMDATHHEYIVKALQLGCDAITEKPMTTDDEKCRAIMDAVQQTGHKVRVAFNYRWSAGTTKVRELIADGTIGNIKNVNLEYLLNTSHGADYFRRWHSDKSCSGGLLVHKSTHHFDLVNWWIDAIPEEVFAYGALSFYGRDNAMKRSDDALTRYDRYTGATEAERDPFAFTMEAGFDKDLYRDSEAESGYIRDRNVFREGITIEDTMSVLVRYRTGVLLNYSLVAYSPYEGYRVTFTGNKGRIEYTEIQKSHIVQDDIQAAQREAAGGGSLVHLRVIPMFKQGYDIPIDLGGGGHGGGDPLLQEQIFSANAPEEKWGRNAGHEQGAASILVGIAANRSMATGQPVRIEELCQLAPSAQRLSELV